MIIHPSSHPRRLQLPGLAGDPVAKALGRLLDDDHHWFRHVAAGGGEPIDAVLVGPGGVWTLTHDGERGRFARRNTGHWYRWHRGTGSWVPWEAVPVTRARLAGRRLALHLEAAGISADVHAVLVPPAGTEIELPRGEVFAVRIEPDAAGVARMATAESVLSRSQVDRIVALLDPREPVPRLAQATRGG
jgi:hypothetical protein